ncbi:beta-lactamase/transpeptidase-like protein [Hyaloraphidium curvatum]|nr:beta-lactamase/transpeptidase-like protein [Hyaloraphidium curvatum]
MLDSPLAKAAAAAGGAVLLAGLAARRVLSAGAFSPASAVFFGPPTPPKAADLAKGEPDADGLLAFDLDSPRYSATGRVHPDYLPVLDAFLANVCGGHEAGAGFCFYAGGRPVVDIAGGLKDNGRKYDLGSVNQIFSSGKAIMAVVVAFCVDRGYLSYDMKVADVWPEFAQGNKHDVTVGDLLRHRGGVGWLDDENKFEAEEFWDLDGVVDKLARQGHNYGGEKVHSYHAATNGWYLNEVLRRTHPKRYTAKDVLDLELMPLVARKDDPHGFPVYVSVPETPEVMRRVWDLTDYPTWRVILRALFPLAINPDPLPEAIRRAISSGPNPVAERSLAGSVPKVTKPCPVTEKPPRKTAAGMNNHWGLRRGQHPAFGTLSNARSMARLAALICYGGELDGVRVISQKTVDEAMSEDPDVQECRVLRVQQPWTKGGWAVGEGQRYPHQPPSAKSVARGKGARWTGWFGYAGSVLQWDAGRGIAFAYCPSGLQVALLGDFRSERLLEAALTCFEAAGKKE